MVLKRCFVVTLFLISTLFINVSAQENQITFDSYLVKGPVNLSLPALNEGDSKVKVEDLVKFEHFDKTNWRPSENAEWKKTGAEEGTISFDNPDGTQAYYIAAYITSNKFAKGTIKVESCKLLNVYFDAENIGSQESFKEEECGSVSKEVELENGTHLLLIKTVSDAEQEGDWEVTVSFTPADDFTKESFTLTTDNTRKTTLSDLLDNTKATSVGISYNGDWASVTLRERSKDKSEYKTWVRLFSLDGSKHMAVDFPAGSDVTSIDWANKSNKFAYTTSGKSGSTLWVYDLTSLTNEKIMEDVKDFSGFYWAPDDSYMLYIISDNEEAPKDGLKKYDKIVDKWPYANNKTFIYKYDFNTGVKERLIAGELSISYHDVSPDGKQLIFSRTKYGETERPFSKTEVHLMDIATKETKKFFDGRFISSAQFSPSGKTLLVLGGPSCFGEIGRNLPEGMIPNEYDTQAYLYDINSEEVTPISKEFYPNIGSAYWYEPNTIYFTTTDKSSSHLYKYDVTTDKYEYVDLGVEDLDGIAIAKEGSGKAVYRGSSSTMYGKVYVTNFAGTNKTLFDPEADKYADIKLGGVKDWTFTNDQGKEILGRVYYPPNFNEDEKYPCIVYYYGGTSPVGRGFEGRYPFNYYASNGYVVYVLQPTGAVGFGQEYSAIHVNDWGNQAGSDIIKGTKEFLDAHKFVDPERVGCIGASYGGFMTMSLLTKTDMFAAGISHAGISTLTSYWGEGYWGHLYSAVATANSYPWNRKDIYVDQSPIYSADKINTPLLLLHGGADNNVPKGESWTMYTALRILGKDVEFVEVEGQDHWIIDYDKRIKWTKTIIAYFDWKLKDQPDWWKSLYK